MLKFHLKTISDLKTVFKVDLESEVNGHRNSLDRLIASGNEMAEQGHFAGTEIKA